MKDGMHVGSSKPRGSKLEVRKVRYVGVRHGEGLAEERLGIGSVRVAVDQSDKDSQVSLVTVADRDAREARWIERKREGRTREVLGSRGSRPALRSSGSSSTGWTVPSWSPHTSSLRAWGPDPRKALGRRYERRHVWGVRYGRWWTGGWQAEAEDRD